MTLGEKIFNLRKSLGLSQEELATILKVSRQAISKWEGNQAHPDLSNIKELARVFNVSFDELFDNKKATSYSSIEDVVLKRQHFVLGLALFIAGTVIFCVILLADADSYFYEYRGIFGRIYNDIVYDYNYYTLLQLLLPLILALFGFIIMYKTSDRSKKHDQKD